jgi:hypothetical protein
VQRAFRLAGFSQFCRIADVQQHGAIGHHFLGLFASHTRHHLIGGGNQLGG